MPHRRLSVLQYIYDSIYVATRKDFTYKFSPYVHTKFLQKVNDKQWKYAVKDDTVCQHIRYLLSRLESNYETIPVACLDSILEHLRSSVDAKGAALKAAGVRILLKTRERCTDDSTLKTIREALAHLGYVEPVQGPGIRILTIDGGGIRALAVIEMLKKLEEVTGHRTHELFDFICGVSTGAIIALGLGVKHYSLDEAYDGFIEISNRIFKQSALRGTGNLVWSYGYYDTTLWEESLKRFLGTDLLMESSALPHCPKLATLSAVVNRSALSAYVFRNYVMPPRVKSHFHGGSNFETWQAARASAAAPTYFDEYKYGSYIFQDGGILANNPTAIAIHEAKLLWPNTPLMCVVSLGTGRTISLENHECHDDLTIGSASSRNMNATSHATSTSWANKFSKFVDSATDTEGVHVVLNDVLSPEIYYRFNPYLSEKVTMVEIRPDKIKQMLQDTAIYIRRNEDKFQRVGHILVSRKNYLQKLKDFIDFTKAVYWF